MEVGTAISLCALAITLGGTLWRIATSAAATRSHVERLQADVTALQVRAQQLDENKVSAKVLTERLIGQKRHILNRVEISRLSGQPVTDKDD